MSPAVRASPNADDGAIYFKWYESSSYYVQCWLWAPSPCVIEVNLRYGGYPVGTASTFGAWMAFMPQTAPAGATGVYSLVSTWSRQFGIGNYGSKIGFDLATGGIAYFVGVDNLVAPFGYLTAPTLPGEWHHYVTQVIKLAEDSYRRRIYLDAVKVYELVGDLSAIGSGCYNQAGLTLGGGNSNYIWSVPARETDEVAMWTSELSQAQILTFTTRVAEHGGFLGVMATTVHPVR
jgi:hypothetical protein